VLDRALDSAEKELQSILGDSLQGEGLIVAQSCIQSSVKFVTHLSTWMSRECAELLKRGCRMLGIYCSLCSSSF
jgi:hypothetical protein